MSIVHMMLNYSWEPNAILQGPCLTAKGKTTKLMNDFLQTREESKPMKQWSPSEVQDWLCEEALKHNYDYEKIDLSRFSNVNGETLLNMTNEDFEKMDREYGSVFFRIVKNHTSNEKTQRKGSFQVADKYKLGTKIIMSSIDPITQSNPWVMLNPILQGPHLTAKGKTTKLMNDFLQTREASKPMKQWSPSEVQEWLCEEAMKHNYDYEKIDLSCFSEVNGEILLNMTIDDFEKKDKESGKVLFKIVKKYIGSGKSQKKVGKSLEINKTGQQIKRNRKKKCGSVLEFIRGLLKEPEYCPSLICWENYEEGIFRFVQNDKVARLWGEIKGNPKMNFEKLSRAIRHYYKKKIFQSVPGKLKYAFGARATGWQTDDPNFQKSTK